MGELADVFSVDIGEVDFFFPVFACGSGGEGDSAGGEARGAGEGLDEGIGELVSGTAGVPAERGFDERGAA